MEKRGKETVQEPKVIKVKIQKNKTEQPPAALFTSKEVRQFVTQFVSSWIRGDIVIRFPTANELSKKNPLAIAFPTDPSINEELKIKEHYVDLLLVCAGVKPASTEEQDKAVTEVFRMLLMFRSANRIEGKIYASDLEKRLTNLEEKQRQTQGLISQITGFLFKGKKPEP
jgi:hypothetical protein